MVEKQEGSGTTLVKAKEVASRLNISISHTYRLMRSGRIRSLRIGKLLRVRAADLDDFIEHNFIPEQQSVMGVPTQLDIETKKGR